MTSKNPTTIAAEALAKVSGGRQVQGGANRNATLAQVNTATIASTIGRQNLRRYAATETPIVAIIGDSTSTELASSVHPIETLWGQIVRALRRANPTKVHTFHNRGIGASNFNSINQTGTAFGGALPSWFTDPGATWLSYVQALNVDTLFICSGINTSDAAHMRHIDTMLTTISGWAKVPDLIFVTNKMLNPDATWGQVGSRNNQLAQAAGVRHLVRSQANGMGVLNLPPLGLLDCGRYYCQAFEGYDPCAQGLDSLSTTATDITTFPYLLPECDGDFDVQVTFTGQSAISLLTGSNLIFLSLANFFQSTVPWHRVRIGEGGGNVNTRIIVENSMIAGTPTAALTPLIVRVLARDERIVVIINGATTFDGLVPRYQHRFRPAISFTSTPPGGTKMVVNHFRAGRRRVTTPFLTAIEIWGAPGGDGNKINHLSSFGVAALDAVVLDAQNLAVGSSGKLVRNAASGYANITLPATTTFVLIDGASTIAAAAFTMPPSASMADGHVIRFSTSQTVTALTLTANTSQTIVGGPTTMNATTPFALAFDADSGQWTRV